MQPVIVKTAKRPTGEKEQGYFFGYPQCCIDFYLKNSKKANWFYNFIKIGSYLDEVLVDGFIPCQKHLKAINDKKIKPKDLIKNRKCPIPFPHEEGY